MILSFLMFKEFVSQESYDYQIMIYTLELFKLKEVGCFAF